MQWTFRSNEISGIQFEKSALKILKSSNSLCTAGLLNLINGAKQYKTFINNKTILDLIKLFDLSNLTQIMILIIK